MSEKFDISTIILTTKRYKGWFMGGIVISLIIMSLYLWVFAKPIYQSSTQLLISQNEAKETTVQSQDIQANLDLVNTYSTIITSPRILNEVRKNLENRYSEESIKDAIKVSNDSNSQIIEIIVEDHNLKATVEIANTTAKVFKDQIFKIMKINNVTVLSSAKEMKNIEPIRPKKALMLILALFLGIALGIVCIVLKIVLDKTVKGSDDIETVLGITLLGTVSLFK